MSKFKSIYSTVLNVIYFWLLKVTHVYLTVGVVVLFSYQAYCCSCDQQHLPQATLVTAEIKIVVCQQGCGTKVGFGRSTSSAFSVKPSGLLEERWSVKNIACASLSKSLVWWVDWLSGPALEVTPYFWQLMHLCWWRVSDITVGQPKHWLHTRPSR